MSTFSLWWKPILWFTLIIFLTQPSTLLSGPSLAGRPFQEQSHQKLWWLSTIWWISTIWWTSTIWWLSTILKTKWCVTTIWWIPTILNSYKLYYCHEWLFIQVSFSQWTMKNQLNIMSVIGNLLRSFQSGKRKYTFLLFNVFNVYIQTLKTKFNFE